MPQNDIVGRERGIIYVYIYTSNIAQYGIGSCCGLHIPAERAWGCSGFRALVEPGQGPPNSGPLPFSSRLRCVYVCTYNSEVDGQTDR